MSNFRRRLMCVQQHGGLPAEYQEVEYIESTGKQWIDTGYYSDQYTNAKYKISVSMYKTYGSHLLSGRLYWFPFYRNFHCDLVAQRGGSSLSLKNMTYSANTIYEYEAFKNNKIIIDGKIIGELSAGMEKDTTPLCLGSYAGDPNNTAYTLVGKIYYCKIYNIETLERNFIPCYSTTTVTDVDGIERPVGTVGMYDTVEGKFYTNQGTGEFLYG